MIIDTCTYIGHWPFRKFTSNTLAELTAKMEKRGISHIVCSNLNGIFYIDPMEGNREFIEELRNYKGNTVVIPFAVINPNYIEWERDIEECKEAGFKGIVLTPQYHGYSLKDDIAKKTYALCEKLKLAVKIDVGFENIRQRHPLDSFKDVTGSEIASLLSSGSKPLTIISSTFLSESGAMGLSDDCRLAALERDNVYFNMIYADSYMGLSLEDHIKKYGPEHLCFGTQAPFRYIEPQLIKMYTPDSVDDKTRDAILYKNLADKLI